MKLTRLFALSAAVLGTTVAARAQTVTPNPTPTIITTAPYTINASGYYQLGANLTVSNTSGAIITINAGNVTLDFGGHYISGPSTVAANTNNLLVGVASNERGNLIIQNGTIAYCYEGIALAGSGNSGSVNVNQTVKNMLVTYCLHYGVFFNNTLYSRVMDSVVSNIGVGGATASDGSGNVGLYMQGTGNSFSRNYLIGVVAPSNNPTNSYGAFIPENSTAIAVGNQIFNCYSGIFSDTDTTAAFKYEDNLTIGCTTSFSGGMSVGFND